MRTSALLSASLLAFALPSARAAVDFDKDIRPILETNCVRCHNPKGTDFEEGKTDVDLTTKTSAFEVVSTIVPGKPDKSKLYTTTTLPDDAKKVMPPRNKVTNALERLSKQETDLLKTWIEEGALWPDSALALVARKKAVAPGAAGVESEIVADIYKRIVTSPLALNEKEMQPFTTTIAGSEVSYEMLPIPGGKFKMGSPDSEPGHKPDESPVHEAPSSPFSMGRCEWTENDVELFMYPDEDKKTRAAKQLEPALNNLTDAI